MQIVVKISIIFFAQQPIRRCYCEEDEESNGPLCRCEREMLESTAMVRHVSHYLIRSCALIVSLVLLFSTHVNTSKLFKRI